MHTCDINCTYLFFDVCKFSSELGLQHQIKGRYRHILIFALTILLTPITIRLDPLILT